MNKSYYVNSYFHLGLLTWVYNPSLRYEDHACGGYKENSGQPGQPRETLKIRSENRDADR